jgi:cytochrome c biogenesis protein CcdA
VTFLAAVAVFAFTTAGPLGGIVAFALYAATVGGIVATLAVVGAAGGESLAMRLRVWSARIQPAAAAVVILVGAVLVYDGLNHFLDGLILGH